MKKFFAVWLAAAILVAALAACEGKTAVGAATLSQNTADTILPSATTQTEQVTSNTQAASATPAGPTLIDQQNFENALRNFAASIEQKNFRDAEQYCTPAYIEYLENMSTGKGGVADSFGLAISQGYTLKLKDIRGFYENGTAQPDFNISSEKPTVSFLVTFEYTDADGQQHDAGGFATGVRSKDGSYQIGGFASSL